MMINSRIAANRFGTIFTSRYDCIGYLPLLITGFVVLIAGLCLAIEVSPWYTFLAAAPFAACIAAMTLTFSRYAQVGSDTRTTVDNYWSLTKTEQKMLPSKTAKRILDLADYDVNRKVNSLIGEIKDARVNNGERLFLDQIQATHKNIAERNKTYREFFG